MREGDVLVVTKPDRLARSTAELLAIEADLSQRGIGLLVLSMGGERLDTRNPTSKLMLTILGGVATWEREIMLERQREGIAKAKADSNSHFGFLEGSSSVSDWFGWDRLRRGSIRRTAVAALRTSVFPSIRPRS
jgi:DNA invertase Pin-like site-specific DNA recombinase